MLIRNRAASVVAAIFFLSSPLKANGLGVLLNISGSVGFILGGGPNYPGSGDIVSGAIAWYSWTRPYNKTDASPVCNVCTPSDATCADLLIVNGVATIPSSLSACNNSTTICTVKATYDKSGNGNNLTQATIANRPIFVVPGTTASPNGYPQNSRPCINLASAASHGLCITNFNGSADFAQPLTITAVEPLCQPKRVGLIIAALDKGLDAAISNPPEP